MIRGWYYTDKTKTRVIYRPQGLKDGEQFDGAQLDSAQCLDMFWLFTHCARSDYNQWMKDTFYTNR